MRTKEFIVSISTLIALLPLAYLLLVSIPLIITDIREHRLPNKMVLPFIAMSIITDIIASAVGGQWGRLGIALSLAFGVAVLGLVANYFDLLGMGDVKLFFGSSLVIGWFSWGLALAVIGGTLVLGFMVTLINIFVLRKPAGTSIPLGPYGIGLALVLGTLGVLSI